MNDVDHNEDICRDHYKKNWMVGQKKKENSILS